MINYLLPWLGKLIALNPAGQSPGMPEHPIKQGRVATGRGQGAIHPGGPKPAIQGDISGGPSLCSELERSRVGVRA